MTRPLKALIAEMKDKSMVTAEDFAALIAALEQSQQRIAELETKAEQKPMFFMDAKAAERLIRGYTRFATVTNEPKEGKTLPLYVIAASASPLAVKLPPRKTSADYVDGEYTNEDLAAIYNVTRLECSVRIKNAGGQVEGE